MGRYNNGLRMLIQGPCVVYALARSSTPRRRAPENADQVTGGHHAERGGFSRASSVAFGSKSMEESDDCWIHMLEYNPPR